MSILTIKKAKFQKFVFKSKSFGIFSIHVSREDGYAIEELIARDPKLSKYLNNTNRPKINVSCDIKSEDFIACNFSLNTLLDFEVSDIKFNGKYNNFTLTMESYSEVEIAKEEKILNFMINNLSGIGEVKAKKILSTFTTDELEKIFENENTIKRLCTLPEIKEIDLPELLSDWQKSYYKLELFEKCKILNLRPAVIHKAIEVFGHSAYENLLKPYHMAVYQDPETKRYISILNWEDIQNMKLPSNAVVSEKLKLSAAYRLAYYEVANQMGSTVIPFLDLAQKIYVDYLKKEIPIENINEYLVKFSTTEKKFLTEEKAFVRFKEKQIKGDKAENPNSIWVTINPDYKLEMYLVEKLKEYMVVNVHKKNFNHQDIEDFKKETTNLDETQKNAVIAAMQHRILYVTGGPGTGKTYTINFIKKVFQKKGLSCAFVAPTAKAADRILENTGEEAMTIHRMFKIRPDDVENDSIEAVHLDGGQSIFENEDGSEINEPDLLIIDESSMLSMALMAKVFSQLNPAKTTIIFVGDIDQLPSIERGCFFKDLILSKKIAGARLEVLHRTDENSLIAQNAKNIRESKPCIIKNVQDSEFIEAKNDLEIQEKILEIHHQLKNENVSIMDIQTLTPQNNTCVGVDDLNILIKDIFNPKTELNKTNSIFSVNDKVMQTINNNELQAFNGSVGVIKEYKPESDLTVVRFGEKEDSLGAKTVTYPKGSLAELKLAYAITTHKSQGSDYTYVICVLSPTHKRMLKRSLIYTGVTRAKKKIFYVGDMKYLTNPDYLLPEEPRYTNFGRLLANLNTSVLEQAEEIPNFDE